MKHRLTDSLFFLIRILQQFLMNPAKILLNEQYQKFQVKSTHFNFIILYIFNLVVLNLFMAYLSVLLLPMHECVTWSLVQVSLGFFSPGSMKIVACKNGEVNLLSLWNSKTITGIEMLPHFPKSFKIELQKGKSVAREWYGQ